MALYGYMRVSTQDKQSFARQLTQLLEYEVRKENIYHDKISGSTKNRPALDELLNTLQKDDKLVILSIDRLGRSVKNLLAIIDEIKGKGGNVVSIQESC